MRRPRWPFLAVLAVASGALLWRQPWLDVPALQRPGGPAAEAPAAGLRGVRLALFARGLEGPVHLIAPPGDRGRLFVVEKGGRVVILRPDGERLAEPFLDLRGQVSRDLEQGLLSLAFHPRYAENRRFFIDYTDRSGATRVVEMRARDDDPDRADPASARDLLAIPQPYSNHNGGHLLFGPDGYLYIGMGDGGSADDPHGHGQDPQTLLGAILRIDVDRAGTDGRPYAIPASNPFASGQGGRPEVFVIGVRNPWRMAFDPVTRDLFVADVGQNRWEEVSVLPGGGRGGENLGWARMEGFHRFQPGASLGGLVEPVVEYSHEEGASITGGVVYRGRALPDLGGCYFYADYATALIRSFRFEGGEAREHTDWTAHLNPDRLAPSAISSFGEDADGEVYVLSLRGEIYRLERAR